MKTQTSTTRVLALVLIAAALTGSLAQNATQPPSASPRPASPAPALADVDSKTSPAASAPRLSPWTTEIVKLAHAGIDEGVVLSFIQNSGMFNLGADQIIHLAGVGVSSQLLNAMLQHDYDLTSGAKLPTITSQPPLDPAIEKALAALRETESKTAALPPLPPSATTPSSSDVPTVPSIEFTPQTSPLATSVEAGKAEVADPHETPAGARGGANSASANSSKAEKFLSCPGTIPRGTRPADPRGERGQQDSQPHRD